MKQYIHTLLAAVAVVTLLGSCVKDELNENSVIKVTETEKNDFDRWLEANFLLPYNIAFKYRFEMNESNMNYFEVPAKEDWSIVMAHLVKYLCVESYDEVAGIAFTRTYFPKMFFLTCSSSPAPGSTATTVPSSWVRPKAARRSSWPVSTSWKRP